MFPTLQAKLLTWLAAALGVLAVVLRIQSLKNKAEAAEQKAQTAQHHAAAHKAAAEALRKTDRMRKQVRHEHIQRQKALQKELKQNPSKRDHMEDTW